MNETLFIREYVTFEENIKKILTEIDPQWTIRIDDIDWLCSGIQRYQKTTDLTGLSMYLIQTFKRNNTQIQQFFEKLNSLKE